MLNSYFTQNLASSRSMVFEKLRRTDDHTTVSALVTPSSRGKYAQRKKMVLRYIKNAGLIRLTISEKMHVGKPLTTALLTQSSSI